MWGGKEALLAKCAIVGIMAFDSFPGDFDLGFSFLGSIYVDMALLVDCTISCSAFDEFRTFLECVFCH